MNPTWNCILTLISHSKEASLSDKKVTLWGDHEALAISPNGQILATANRWGSIKIRDLETQQILYTFDCSNKIEQKETSEHFGHLLNDIRTTVSELGQSSLLEILPDGRTLVCSSAEETRIWDLENKELQHTLPGSINAVVNLKHQLIATEKRLDLTDSLLIEIWDLNNKVLLYTIDTKNSQSVDHIALSANGKFLAVSGSHLLDWGYDSDNEECFKVENSVKVWDLCSRTLLCKLKTSIDTRSEKDIPSVEINSNEKTLITIDGWLSDEPLTEVWDLSNGKKLFTLSEEVDRGILAISPDGNLIISSAKNFAIKVWDSSNGKLLSTLAGHSDLILSLTVSKDSLTLISSSGDKTIKIWNLQTNELLQTLIGHSCSVQSVSLNLNEDILASTDAERTVKIWKNDS